MDAVRQHFKLAKSPYNKPTAVWHFLHYTPNLAAPEAFMLPPTNQAGTLPTMMVPLCLGCCTRHTAVLSGRAQALNTALMPPADEAAAAAAAVAPRATASAPYAPSGMSAAAAAAMAQAELARAELEAGHWEDERSGGLATHMYDNPLAMGRSISAAQVRRGTSGCSDMPAATCQMHCPCIAVHTAFFMQLHQLS